jgi:hypothetical protein
MDIKGFFVSLFVGTLVVAGLYLLCVNPEVVVARIRFHGGTKGWDRILLCFFLPAAYAVFLVAALDYGRHWLPVPWCDRLHDWPAAGARSVRLLAGADRQEYRRRASPNLLSDLRLGRSIRFTDSEEFQRPSPGALRRDMLATCTKSPQNAPQ